VGVPTDEVTVARSVYGLDVEAVVVVRVDVERSAITETVLEPSLTTNTSP
jgi:hypothetical protein